MLIKKSDDIKSSEITDEKLYFNRRNFLRGALLAGTVGSTGRSINPARQNQSQ